MGSAKVEEASIERAEASSSVDAVSIAETGAIMEEKLGQMPLADEVLMDLPTRADEAGAEAEEVAIERAEASISVDAVSIAEAGVTQTSSADGVLLGSYIPAGRTSAKAEEAADKAGAEVEDLTITREQGSIAGDADANASAEVAHVPLADEVVVDLSMLADEAGAKAEEQELRSTPYTERSFCIPSPLSLSPLELSPLRP